MNSKAGWKKIIENRSKIFMNVCLFSVSIESQTLIGNFLKSDVTIYNLNIYF